jgi:acyl-coenzyme A thioesterase PaaI-like protein
LTSSPQPGPARRNGSQIRIAGQLVELAPHHCFACGELNAHGLHLELHADGDSCWTELSLGQEFEGWEGLAHGGILCTILDEVMAWALIGTDSWGLTARMAVEFRRPVMIGTRLRAEGRLVGRRRRVFDAAGRLVDAETGLELVTAEGTYVAAPEDRKQRLKERYGFRVVGAGARAEAAGTGGPRQADIPGPVDQIPVTPPR